MQIINRLEQNHGYYNSVYDQSYITDHLQAGSDNSVRLSSQWWAARAAGGIDPFSPSKFDVVFKKQIQFEQQVRYLQQHQTRTPQCIMEVGSGCGELSAVLCAGFNSELISVDCNPHVAAYHNAYLDRLNANTEQYSLWLGTVYNFLDMLPHNLDTVIFVESLEHMLPNEWPTVRDALVERLTANRGRLIITNPIWPLIPNDWDHILLMNDRFFDQLCEHGTALWRNRGYICIEY